MQETPAVPTSTFPALSNATLLMVIVGRTLVNIPIRIISPFLPTIARTLGVTLGSAGVLASVLGGMGLIAPLTGRLSDRYGRRRLMQLSMILLTVMAVIAAISRSFNIVLVAFAGFGIAKALYNPAVLAYLGDAVPYSQRGRVMGLSELGWSAAWLFGVVLGGFFVERAGPGTLWWVVAGVAAVSVAGIQVTMPPARSEHKHTESVAPLQWGALLRMPVVWAVIAISFLMLFALENVFILYGAYLEDQFSLTLGVIGIISIVIALAEMAAEVGAAGLADRIGKRRSVILGLIIFGILVPGLPLAGGAAWLTVAMFACAIFVFEYTVVSFVPLVSELLPTARATLLGVYSGALAVGRMLAPVVGTRLYEQSGSLLMSCVVSAIAVWIAVLIVWRGIPKVIDN